MKADCAFCPKKVCFSKGINCTEVTKEEVIQSYTEEEKKLMFASADIEKDYESDITRLQETAEFAKRLGYKKIGMAFCIGLASEAEMIAQYFTNQGFEFCSVCCKTCSVNKKELNLKQTTNFEHEAMCNPKMQARFLNEKNVDLYISCGLCVGHDTIFHANCNGYVTILVVKDRLLGHNPLAAIYSRYWLQKLGLKEKRTK